MQQYKYKAVDLQKKKFSGVFMAQDEEDLATQLSKQGLYLVSATPYSGKTPSSFFTAGTGKVTLGELTVFCRQFSIMLNSGVPLLGCIEILKEQSFSSYFKKLLQIIYEDVKSGIMLSEALNKHKTVFPDFFRNMIKVGESSSKLDLVFDSLAEYYEKDSAIKHKTKSAFSYPLMLLSMTVGIVVLMMVFIIPTFRSSLSSMNIQVEGVTKIVYDMSDFMIANWLNMLAILIVIIAAFFIFGKTKKGKYCYDWMKMHVPFIKKVNIDLVTSRFARGFGLLLSSGMDITNAMEAVTIVLGNRDVEFRFRKAAEDVKHGMNVALAFDQYKLFPRIMIQMVAVGERTASLDDVLNRSCKFFDDAVDSSLNSITQKIQPIMLLILGVIIAVLFIAVYSPIISIMNGLNVEQGM